MIFFSNFTFYTTQAMIKNTFLFLFVLLFQLGQGTILAQDSTSTDQDTSSNKISKNTVYGELAGKGFYYSFNYERMLFQMNEKLSVNASVGFCIMNGNTSAVKDSKDKLFPFEINLRYNLKKNHNIVFGWGFTKWKYYIIDIPISNSNVNQQPVAPVLKENKETFSHLTLDYRYQKPGGGLMLKAGITPLFFGYYANSALTKKVNPELSFNIAVGYSF